MVDVHTITTQSYKEKSSMNVELFFEALAWIAVTFWLLIYTVLFIYNKTVVFSIQKLRPKWQVDIAGLIGAVWLLSVYLK